MSDERAERVATGATVEQWWGWNIERQKWFPCLQREERECVVDGGVIVFASIEGRDRRRDEIVGMARAVLAALDEEPTLEQENARLRAQVGRLQHAIHIHNRDRLRVTLQLDDMGQLPPLDIPPIAEERNGLLFGDLDPLEADDA